MAGEIGGTPVRPTTTGRLTQPPRAGNAPVATETAARRPADRNGARTATGALPGRVNVEAVDVPGLVDKTKATRDTAADLTTVADGVGQLAKAGDKATHAIGKTTKGLGVVGVLTSLKGLADAFKQSPLQLGLIATAVSELGMNLADAAGELEKIPGLANALKVFGGIGGVVTGVMQLADELKGMKKDGVTLSNATGALAGLCNMVGGLAVAISPVFPPAAAVGGALMIAGSALNVGKLAADNWDTVRSTANRATAAVGGAVTNATRNVTQGVTDGAARAWRWLTN